MSSDLHFTYPAFYELVDGVIIVEIPDLEIGPFKIPAENQKDLVDVAWSMAAHKVQDMINSGVTPPPSRTLKDLEISDKETRDAFLIELIS